METSLKNCASELGEKSVPDPANPLWGDIKNLAGEGRVGVLGRSPKQPTSFRTQLAEAIFQRGRHKGNSVVELIFVIPFFCVLLFGLHHLYQQGIGAQARLVLNQKRAKANLFKNQAALPVLQQTCLVHPLICRERK